MFMNGFSGAHFMGGPGGGPRGPGGPHFGGGPGGPHFGGPGFHGGFRPPRPPYRHFWRGPMGCGCLPLIVIATAVVILTIILL